jgi:hypothetical protein
MLARLKSNNGGIRITTYESQVTAMVAVADGQLWLPVEERFKMRSTWLNT